MTTTETRPADHTEHLDYNAYCRSCVAESRRVLAEVLAALDEAERGGETVVRIDAVRAIVGGAG